MFWLGHLSDLHSTPVEVRNPTELFNKRVLGWLSWQVRRNKIHLPHVLESLIEDLGQMSPDHVVVTGDLTNISLKSEFSDALGWLKRLGGPEAVSLVPGNHDAYVPVSYAQSWRLWADYLASDDTSFESGTDARDAFPTLRMRGPVAVVGVCSALPTPALYATGTVGSAQMERLERMLVELGDSAVCRVISIHHPVTPGATIERRSLTDSVEFRSVLARAGAELVVHGHNHRTQVGQVDGADGPVPVVGVRSASDCGHKPHKRAQYHLYGIETSPAVNGARPSFRLTLRTRGYDAQKRCFVAEGDQELTGI
jgi:3',5'-cyclic AMP phosphodiesterase CpdA